LDTSSFYTDDEKELDKKLQKIRSLIVKKKNKYGDKKKYNDMQKRHIATLNKMASETKCKLKKEISNNVGEIRCVRKDIKLKKLIVSVFDSCLTRSLSMSEEVLNCEIVIVKVYYFGVAENIIKNGFYMNGEKYVFFSASAGQIRTKKFVAVKEDSLKKVWNTLTCGLSVSKINEMGGVNTNKYLAYLSLCNSATDLWEDFNIDRCIVVDDFETNVTGIVDFIDEKTYKINRMQKAVPITHTDGCGMVLPSVSKKNFMVRMPWMKGLLASFPYDKFIREANKREPTVNHGLVRDIYGVEHDILGEKIEVIFTKSQFKMWKYFKNWSEYQENFKRYACSAGKCNIEDDFVPNAKFNYQMMQTLTDLTDDELNAICERANNDLGKVSSDRNTMLKVFGATKENSSKNSFQECLMIYPELLQDVYTRSVLRDLKKSMEKEARAARLDIDGKYLFLIPDLYAFCENLFLGYDDPSGLLDNGEVYCRVYSNSDKLDCLRSPHLYREHAIRRNRIDNELKRWFTTNGIYTSCHDLISKILQFDNDGDKSLVCADKTIIEAAERNLVGIVPLYYEMAKAPAQPITNDAIYNGMIAAYTGGNIGEISNNITKIWNSKEPNLDAIKILCMENNFTIDYAKTLYKPKRPDSIDAMIKSAISGKLPHFFLFAKDKHEYQVERRSKSCVDRLYDIVKVHKFDFKKKQLGTFDYKMLMKDNDFKIDESCEDLIHTYYSLTSNVSYNMSSKDDGDNYNHVFSEIRNKLLDVEPDIYRLVDILVLQLFKIKKARHKIAFWNCFGDIVPENLRHNIDQSMIICERCGKRFVPNAEQQKLCDDCAGYQKLEIKIIKCIDCGRVLTIKAWDMKTTRCKECQYTRDKERKRIWKQNNNKK